MKHTLLLLALMATPAVADYSDVASNLIASEECGCNCKPQLKDPIVIYSNQCPPKQFTMVGVHVVMGQVKGLLCSQLECVCEP